MSSTRRSPSFSTKNPVAPHRDPRLREPVCRSAGQAAPGGLPPARCLLQERSRAFHPRHPRRSPRIRERRPPGAEVLCGPRPVPLPELNLPNRPARTRWLVPPLRQAKCSPRPPVGGDSRPDRHPAALPEGHAHGTGSRATGGGCREAEGRSGEADGGSAAIRPRPPASRSPAIAPDIDATCVTFDNNDFLDAALIAAGHWSPRSDRHGGPVFPNVEPRNGSCRAGTVQ